MKNKSVFGYTSLFIILVLIQILIFNNIHFGGYINPYVYVLFVMLLPIDTRGGVLLLLAFFLGLTIDVFLDSPGMHAAATLCLAFSRPAVIRLISVRSDFEPGTVPAIADQGFRWVATYTLLLLLAHHIPLFFLEIFRFDEIWPTLYRVFISTLFSFLFIMPGFYLIGKTSDSRN
jgi:rod shape-determining protein MreD